LPQQARHHPRRARRVLIAALAALPGVTPFPSEANMVLVRVPDAQRPSKA
jgi:histidinol-phosphate aminotransferase